MAQFTLTAPTPGTFQTAYINYGAAGLTFTNATAQGVRSFLTTQPTYILGITLVTDATATPAGTFQAAFTSDLTTAATSVMTVTNFGGTAKANASGSAIELNILSSGVTVTTAAGAGDDLNPILIPGNSWVGFNTSAAITAAGPKLLAVIVRYRVAGV